MAAIIFDPIPGFTGAIAFADATQTLAVTYKDGSFVEAIDLKTRLPITTADLTAPIRRIVKKNGKAGMFCSRSLDCAHGALKVGGNFEMSKIKRGIFKAVPPNDKAVKLAEMKKAAKRKKIKRAIAG
jgi:hypothetical protein